MKYAALVIAAFLGALGIGFVKFFSLHYLGDEVYQDEGAKGWIIQIISALMTLGPVLLYPVSAPLAASFSKRMLMSISCILITSVLLVGYWTQWTGSLWLYLFLVGLLISVFGVSKVALIPIEALESKRNTVTVNGVMSIVYVIGMLLGIVLGTFMYKEWELKTAFFGGVSIFALCSIFSFIPSYQSENKQPYKKSLSLLVEDTLRLFFRYPLYLLTSPLLWGVASAVSLGVTAYIEQKGISDEIGASIVPAFAAFGIILGNLVSTKLADRRYTFSTLSALGIALMLLVGSLFMELLYQNMSAISVLYWVWAVFMGILGLLFGIHTNLIDAEFLQLAAKDQREGTGAAMQSTTLALFTFIVGGFVGLAIYTGWMDVVTQFFILSFISFIAVSLTLILAVQKGFFYRSLGTILTYMVKALLSLRYKCSVKNRKLFKQCSSGILLLPNHPAEMDPVILSSLLWLKYKIRPVVTESFYYMPGVHQVLKIMRAFPMPDMENGCGILKKRRIEKVLLEIASALKNGDNVLMYPSGHLMRSGSEYLGAASGVESIIKLFPEAQIILARTKGLWGSSFSTASTGGSTPNLVNAFKGGLKILLLNFIFFAPKRKVSIEFKSSEMDFRNRDRLEINRSMEEYYNEDGEEKVNSVSTHFLTRSIPFYDSFLTISEADLSGFEEDEIQSVLKSLAKFLKVEPSMLTVLSKLDEDLGLDSLTRSELLLWLDDEYEVSDVEITEIKTVGDLVLVVLEGARNISNDSPEKKALLENWIDEDRPIAEIPEGENLAEIFFKQCDRMGSRPAIADPMIGVIGWNRLKMSVLLFANIIKKWPVNRVGVLLPASGLTNILVLACWVAKKTPVMLNWTVGRKNLEHAIALSGLDSVLTSARFLDRVGNIDFGMVESKLLFIEDIKHDEIKTGELVVAWWESRKKAARLIQEWNLTNMSSEEIAVILFTSGSESAPKGVPLSHKNILSNVCGALEILPFNEKSTLYGFLPAFHSFGLTITFALPMLAGIRTAYHPNPMEYRQIAKGIHRYGISLLCGTPTFISGIFRASQGSGLEGLEYIVTGAEKLTEDLKRKVKLLPNTEILEGYGITECSPVISINRPGEKEEGVGKALREVSLLIVDPESMEKKQMGDRGLILVAGESVFGGYLGGNPNPFTRVHGRKWYNTGDLGYLTKRESLVLAGRMKRFIKIAGEMISLPAVEEVFVRKWSYDGDGPAHAVHAIEIAGERPEIWFFSVLDLGIDAINEELKIAGFSNLCRIKRAQKLSEIPCLGTGKTNYPALEEIMRETKMKVLK